MKSQGIFANPSPFHLFLSREAASGSDPGWENEAFVARNFMLDEGVTEERRASYDRSGGARDHGCFKSWRGKHSTYLKEKVSLESDDRDPPSRLSLREPEEVPETFHAGGVVSPFANSDEALGLLRVVAISTIERIARWAGPGRLIEHIESAIAGDQKARVTIDDVLSMFARASDRRPVFAAFWDDLADLFGASPAEDESGWADTIRDRLGLLHLNPIRTSDAIDVCVLRYPMKIVPRGEDRRTHVLAVPTVLDGSMSPAFLPSPAGERTGYTVDLGEDFADVLSERREILHAAVRWRSKHLWRVGHITRPVPPDRLAMARGLQILAVREMAGRPDYAEGTDGDLL